ncbi:MAG: RIP metalloprotease RseP [Bacteroidia bacterium]|nr:RIP metalloprotease RseP [Bacteroidia bacterium]
MEVVIKIAQFILSLSILIVLHELGHFIPAKLFKTRVEKFYLFFDWKFSLFKFKKGETEYGIGWLPLGGYVKIAGMIDESMDKEQMKLPPQPWEFRSKPAWQRLIVMVGGVTVNVILGVLIYAMVLFTWGEQYLPTKNVKYGVAVDTLGYQIGLRDGDKILSVDNKEVENIRKVPLEIILNKATSIQVERDGQKMNFDITEDDLSEMIKNKYMLVEPRFPFEVGMVIKGKAAEQAGILEGDKILAVNGISTIYFQDFVKVVQQNTNLPIDIQLIRNGDTLVKTAQVNEQGKIGIGHKSIDNYFELDTKTYGFFASFPAGIRKANETFSSYLKQMKVLFTVKDAHREIGGFASIANAYSPEWDWQSFWAFTAFLSIVLAIMNILPIPALDGGHVMFLLYEVITRRKPNEKLMEYAQYAGMILLLALLLYANGNDVVKWIFGK